MAISNPPTDLTPELRYHWAEPPASKPLDIGPDWIHPALPASDELAANLAGYEWKTPFLRDQIAGLGVTPQGRTRAQLVQQFAEAFLDPTRVQRSYHSLNEEEQQFYVYLLLYTYLENLQTTPTPLNQLSHFSQSRPIMTRAIHKAGLGMRDADDTFFIPHEPLSLLPPLSLPLPEIPEPAQFVKAADPYLLVSQIQQWMGLLQSHTGLLRPRLRWKIPEVSYYTQNVPAWPPTPDYARQILTPTPFQGLIALYPPESYPDAATLETWQTALSLSTPMIDLLYQVLINARVIMPGNPVKLDEQVAQQWLMASPGRQVTFIYQLYRNVGMWGEWWPAWQAGRVQVYWNYINTWQMAGVERTLMTAHTMLRWAWLDLLALLPHAVWLPLDKVLEFFLQLFPKPEAHYYAQGLTFKHTDGWAGFLRLTLNAILGGLLHHLGMVDVAPDLANPIAFRLHHLQDLHWGRLTEFPFAETQPLTAQSVKYVPQGDYLEITPPASAEFLNTVQRWAKPAGLSQNRLHYRPDVARLHTVFEAGETPETLAAQWRAHGNFPPPAEIAHWWQHWWERYGHVRLYPHQAALMTRDEFTLQELQVALPSLREAIMGLVTPRAALLPAEKVGQVLKDLERQGYMPKEED